MEPNETQPYGSSRDINRDATFTERFKGTAEHIVSTPTIYPQYTVTTPTVWSNHTENVQYQPTRYGTLTHNAQYIPTIYGTHIHNVQ